MITKKTQIEGASLSLSLTPLQAIRNFFGVVESEGIDTTIPRFSSQYRSFRKKIVSQGRLERWGGVETGAMKEARSIARMRDRRKKGEW